MSSFRLDLPTDIPWVRKCVSKDMIDTNLCDSKSPLRWRSSITVFEYEPEEEFQNYEGMTISYLKVACTITGYQEDPKEIGLNYRGLRSYWKDQRIDDYLEILQKYYACYGAVLEVSVGPEDNNTIIDNFPYFLDFEPKKRELYELVSTTGETMSRSLDGIEIGKSNTSLKSHEVVDIDKGFSIAASAKAGPYGGSGSYSSQGEWGSRDVTQNESRDTRAIDAAREMRETQSHTTQLSQMYHQLDSYHLGTNRALFFINPRPHINETEHTFVNGPRNIEGIQEFLFVVARPKEVKNLCVEVYLETGHIGKVLSTVIEEEPQSEVKTIWNDFFHAEPLGNDNETTVWDNRDRIWEVKNFFPGYKIKHAIFHLGTPALDINDSGCPNLAPIPPHLSDTNPDYIKVSGSVRSWFENVASPWRDNSGAITFPFSVDITVVKTKQVEKTKDTLFITGRKLCCCPRDLRPEVFIDFEGVVYEKVLDHSIYHSGMDRHQISNSNMPLVAANRLGDVIKEGIIHSRTDLENRYNTYVNLPQTNFANETLFNAIKETHDFPLLDSKNIPEHIKHKLSILNPDVKTKDIIAMPFEMLKDLFSMNDEEVVELRKVITGVHHTDFDPKEAWLSERQIRKMFRRNITGGEHC